MMTKAQFSVGITRIGIAVRQPADAATQGVYYDAVVGQTTAEEWDSFSLDVVASGRWQFFPTVREVLDALREHRGAPTLEAEANQAYERVLDYGGIYHPEAGTTWSFRQAVKVAGQAAGEAYMAAGGANAFTTTYRENERRNRFVSAYILAVRQNPERSLHALPAAEAKGLLPPGESAPPIDSEAGDILREIKKRMEPEPVVVNRPAPNPPIKRRFVEATDERLNQLRRQAALITQEEEATA